MMDALANSGVVTSPYIYGGIGVILAVIGGLIFLFRRKTRLKLKQGTLQEAYSTQAQEQFAVNIENSAAPDEANDHQDIDAPTDQQPIEATEEQPVLDIAAMFRAAGPSLSEDESEKELDPADDNSSDETQKQRPSGDAMLDLFTTEVEEDDTVGKLAATMDNVDVNDIMSDAQSLINQLKGGK